MRKTHEFYISQAMFVHGNAFDYSNVSKNVKSLDKVEIICPEHGTFVQTMTNHIRGQTCPSCAQFSRNIKRSKGREYFVKKATLTHNNKYEYHLVPIDVMSRDVVEIICPAHGVFSQSLTNHIDGKQGCPHLDCVTQKTIESNITKYGRAHKNQTNISVSSIETLNNTESLTDMHHIQKIPLCEIANMLEISPTTVGRYFKHHEIEVKNFFLSTGENDVAKFLTTLLPVEEIIIRDRSTIYPFELDVFLPKYNLAIEYCGVYWHSEQRGKGKWYHNNKWKKCNERGIRLLTIFEDEWADSRLIIEKKLKLLLGMRSEVIVYARKCVIVNVTTAHKNTFFENTHIQGSGRGSVNLGLHTPSGEMVACMSFIQQHKTFTLNRYATSCAVPGGFSKLLNHFRKTYEYDQIISFADLRWSDGALYTNTGWTLDKIIPPDYYYSPDGKTRYHKFNYRRKNLHKLLKIFNPNLSERENCDMNGVLRIWDCGKMRYIFK